MPSGREFLSASLGAGAALALTRELLLRALQPTGGKLMQRAISYAPPPTAPGKTFDLLHVNKLNQPVLASPAMVDGTWYFRTPFHLMAVGK